jgi:radical SAM superfamily enzyme YgiQ (UPF0313 family)
VKVLLVSINRLASPFPVYPLGLDYVAGALPPRHPVRVLDLGADAGEQVLEGVLAGFGPDVVGVSIRNIDNSDAARCVGYVADARRVVQAVRGACRARVVLGGSGFSIFPAELLEALGADAGVVGEGERLGTLLEAWERGADPAGLAGIALPGRPVEVPPPWAGEPCSSFDPSRPHVEYYLRRGGMLNLQTKRGCPYECTYCTYPVIEGRTVRRFAPDAVARTARRLQDAGARFLFVADSTFNIDVEHNLAVAAAFRAAGVGLPWGAFFAPFRPPEGYYRRLAEAGLTHVEFGTESLAPQVLRGYGKRFSPEDVAAAHAAAVAAGLKVAHYFLLGGPGETRETLRRTLDEAERLERSMHFAFCGLRVYPGTPMHERAVAEGQLAAGQSLLEPFFYRPAGLAPEEIVALLESRARAGRSWIVGAGGERLARIVTGLHARGRTGPLWDQLIE